MNSNIAANRAASAIKKHLQTHGSAEHAAGVQWFFKEEVASHGWYTDDLRRYARETHKPMAGDTKFVLAVADKLFQGHVLEEKLMAVLLAQRELARLGTREFARFERWLDAVSSWADHDATAMFLLGKLLVRHPEKVKRVFVWAKSRDRWRRRAAAVTLIHGIGKGMFEAEASAIADLLQADNDDMVQKGLGWLLRVWCKVHPAAAIPVVMRIRHTAARLVVRTACETLAPTARARVME